MKPSVNKNPHMLCWLRFRSAWLAYENNPTVETALNLDIARIAFRERFGLSGFFRKKPTAEPLPPVKRRPQLRVIQGGLNA